VTALKAISWASGVELNYVNVFLLRLLTFFHFVKFLHFNVFVHFYLNVFFTSMVFAGQTDVPCNAAKTDKLFVRVSSRRLFLPVVLKQQTSSIKLNIHRPEPYATYRNAAAGPQLR